MRKTAAPAKSSARPLRPVIVRAASASTFSGSDDSRAFSGVITKPGTSVLHVTPYRDHASACERASDSSAPLETP